MLKRCSFIIALFIGGLLSASISYAIPVAGSSSGVFINSTGPGGMVVTGVGTDFFSWGVGNPPSSLRFTGNAFSVNSEDVFSFGILDYYNGFIGAGTWADSVDLNATLALTAPSGITESFSFNLGLINTLNTTDPNASADIINLPSTIPDEYFTSGGDNYTLEFLGFGTIVGNGFITVDNFHVLEGGRASAELLGRVTSNFTPVPEPSTYLLLGSGIAGLALWRRKRKLKG